MSEGRSLLKGGALLTLGEAVSKVCVFLRSVIIANYILKDDFGIAALFALTVSLLEILSNFGVEKLIIQDKEGDHEDTLYTVHSFQLLRGVIGAGVLFLLAWPLSRLFGLPDLQWAFELMAVVPLFRGLIHQDLFRLQRSLRYGRYVICEAGSQILVTAVTLPLVLYYRDYRAMIACVIMQPALLMILSHLLAERPYRLRWQADTLRRVAHFGWPLLVNGLVLFAVFQGDKLIIGSADEIFTRAKYTLADLGEYNVAFMLTLMPTLFLSRIATALLLPKLAKQQGDLVAFSHTYRWTLGLIALFGTLIGGAIILPGNALVGTIYGKEYRSIGIFLSALACMQAIRLFRVAPTLAALALGRTRFLMYANGLRLVGVALAVLAAWMGKPLVWIACAGALGELLALLLNINILIVILSAKGRSLALYAMLAGGWMLGWLLLAIGVEYMLLDSSGLIVRSGVTLVFCVMVLLSSLLVLPLSGWKKAYIAFHK